VTPAGDWKRSFGDRPDAAKAEFSKQRPLVELLQESGDRDALAQRIQPIFIGGH
jgi:hypothetical protein